MPSNSMTNFYPPDTLDEINRRLDVRELMQSIGYRFDKYQEGPKTGKGFCPIHREGLFRNLIVDVEARTFRCQYTQCPGSKGGSLVSLYSQACGLDLDVAARRIVRDQQLDVVLPVNSGLVAAELDKAAAELASGQLDAAEAQYTEILDADPLNPEAHHGLFKIYDQRGDLEGRQRELVQVCRLKIEAGRAGDIPELIQEWSETDSDSPDARFAYAELLAARGEAESAVIELMGGGDACEVRGELEAAIHAYKRAAAISAENHVDVIDVTPHIIRVLTQMDRTPEAVEYLYAQADKATAAGNLDAAAELTIMAVDADPSREETHRRLLAAAATVAPTPVVSNYVIGSVAFLREHDDHEGAMHAMETYLAVAPDDEDAIRVLVNDYNNHGRAAEAFDLEARLAQLLLQQGRTEEAQEIINNVLTWQPQHIAMLEVLTDFLDSADNAAEARETRRRLVRSLLVQGRFEDALARLGELSPGSDDDDMLELRATAHEGMARNGNATARELAVAEFGELADSHLDESTGRRAIGYIQRALDLLDEPPNELLFKLARAHLRNKDYPAVRDTVITVCENLAGHDRLDEAILEAERYSNLIPDDTDLVRYLVELYLRFDDKPAAVARMRRLADELSRTGKPEEAETILEQASELEPKNLESLTRQLDQFREMGNRDKIQQTRLRIATFYQDEGSLPEAASALEEYLAETPSDAAAIGHILQVYDSLGREQEARHWRLHLARTYRGAGDNDREARVLRDVLAKFADDEEVLNLLMHAEFERGDLQAGASNALRLATLQRKTSKPESARKTLMKAVERVPENLDINREIYNYHLENKQQHQAITWGKKVIGILRSAVKNADAAMVFEQIVGLDPDNLALKQEQLKFLEETGRETDVADKRLALSKVYRDQERFSDAELLLEAIIKSDPRHLQARHALADLYLHLGENLKAESQLMQVAGSHHLEGNSQEAIAVLRNVISANPAQTDARRQLAQVYRAEGDAGAAVDVLLELADIFRKHQQETEALATEREALELDPYNEEISGAVTRALINAGRLSQAADQMEKMAAHLLASNQLPAALKLGNEIVDLQPSRLAARKLRAEIYTRMGEPEKALQELQELAELAMGADTAAATAPVQVAEMAPRPTLQVVPEYTFEQFVVGSNNDFAYATSLAIARSPARAYNPFFLYANVGLGKTHLCNAIANYLIARDPNTSIIYTNSEDFTDELVSAIQNNAVQQFRTRYRNLDLLIVDDVQFLAGKERAQEEFFHIFNSLFQAKRQIVITSDRPPAEIAHLESRLRSRFGAGVIVDIASPDLETRLAILNREVEDNQLSLEAWVLRLISEKIDTNVRDLKGALNQVIAMRDLRRKELTEENVAQLLDSLYPAQPV